MIDDYNSESNIVAQALGLPLPATSRTFLASLSPVSKLRAYVEQQHPRYFIYAPRRVGEELTARGGCLMVSRVPMCIVRIQMTSIVYMKFLIDSHLLLTGIRRRRVDEEK